MDVVYQTADAGVIGCLAKCDIIVYMQLYAVEQHRSASQIQAYAASLHVKDLSGIFSDILPSEYLVSDVPIELWTCSNEWFEISVNDRYCQFIAQI